MASPSHSPNLVGSGEACESLGIHRSTLSRWVTVGKITPAVRLPGPRGAFLFDRADVEALRDDDGNAA
jgi:excisionase family DNA binding protein